MAKKAAPKAPDYPETIYVVQEPDAGGVYLDAQAELAGFDNGQRVGVYEHIGTRTVRVTTGLD